MSTFTKRQMIQAERAGFVAGRLEQFAGWSNREFQCRADNARRLAELRYPFPTITRFKKVKVPASRRYPAMSVEYHNHEYRAEINTGHLVCGPFSWIMKHTDCDDVGVLKALLDLRENPTEEVEDDA